MSFSFRGAFRDSYSAKRAIAAASLPAPITLLLLDGVEKAYAPPPHHSGHGCSASGSTKAASDVRQPERVVVISACGHWPVPGDSSVWGSIERLTLEVHEVP